MEILAGVLLLLLVWREYENKYLIKDLMDRLMAKDFGSYKVLTKKRNGAIPRARVMTDAELAERERTRDNSGQDQQINDINAELEKHLNLLSNGKSKVGVS